PFYCSPAVAAALPSSLPEVLRPLDKMFLEKALPLLSSMVFLILVSRSGDIEREGLLLFCFICPLCLTASSTQTCSSAPQLVLAGLLTVVTGSRMRQLFSASFQCRIFFIID
ncbi:hypothetical protein TcCL_ESM05142, partial [Trypanosoma cruzi]